MTPRRALVVLIAVSTAVRIVAASNFGLGNDEAYHYLYAVHPSWGYFDHPPMLAWVETAGLHGLGSWDSSLALRLGFILLFAGSTLFVDRIAARWFGDWAGFYAALALNLTGYYGLAASTFALPDGPLLFFWLLTIDRIDRAIEGPYRLGPWIGVGAAWGCALLSKYHAIFLPAGVVLFLALRPERRHLLRKPGPYAAVLVGLFFFSPVVAWNARHEWASFAFQGGRAVGSGGASFRPDHALAALAAQAAYLFPWVWLPLVAIAYGSARRWRTTESDRERLAFCLGAGPLATFTAVACFRPVLPHWGLIGFVPFFPMLGRAIADAAVRTPKQTRRRILYASGFSIGLTALAIGEQHYGWLQRGPDGSFGVLTARTDPTAEVYGWDQVADRLQELGVLDDPNVFLFTRNWYLSAQIAHATRLKRPVVCYNMDDPRGFAFWSEPDEWVGQDGVFVMIDADYTPFSFYDRWFESAEALDDFEVERAGKPIRRVRVFRLRNQLAAVPYQYTREQAERRKLLHEQSFSWPRTEPPTLGARIPTSYRR